jgi:hypothetical protein
MDKNQKRSGIYFCGAEIICEFVVGFNFAADLSRVSGKADFLPLMHKY